MLDQSSEAVYAQAVHDLLGPKPAPKFVMIDGIEILVKKPDDYLLYRLVVALETKRLDQVDFDVEVVRLCIPGNLNRAEALALLAKDNYGQKGKQSKILEAIAEYGSCFDHLIDDDAEDEGDTASAEPEPKPKVSKKQKIKDAGKTADQDFSKADQSDSD